MAWQECDRSGTPWRVERVAIIGFGTRGRCVARALLRCGIEVAAFDRAFAQCASRPARAVSRMAVRQCASIAGAVADSDMVIVATSADAAVEVARAVSDHLDPGTSYLDASGCAPAAADKIDRALRGIAADYVAIDRDAVVARSRAMASRSDLSTLAGRRPVTIARSGALVLPFSSPGRAVLRLPHEAAA